MHVISATNVNDAYHQGVTHLRRFGLEEPSRAGLVKVAPTPVTTIYANPRQRVLFDPDRDANPFFHLFEALWLISGRRDATWLDRFVSDFSKRFAEEDGNQHASYGFRWREHFDIEGGGNPNLPDQLDTLVRLLKENPQDRRAVLTMWDPAADLGADKKDVPCNLIVHFRIKQGELDMMVFCRSNDIIYGCYGANAVHFSMLLEYLAGRVGVGVGKYYQISSNFHAYAPVLEKIGVPITRYPESVPSEYPEPTPIGTNWEAWDEDLEKFMNWTPRAYPELISSQYSNPWFKETAGPLYITHCIWRDGNRNAAFEYLKGSERNVSPDWRRAALAWMRRRLDRSMSKQEGMSR